MPETPPARTTDRARGRRRPHRPQTGLPAHERRPRSYPHFHQSADRRGGGGRAMHDRRAVLRRRAVAGLAVQLHGERHRSSGGRRSLVPAGPADGLFENRAALTRGPLVAIEDPTDANSGIRGSSGPGRSSTAPRARPIVPIGRRTSAEARRPSAEPTWPDKDGSIRLPELLEVPLSSLLRAVADLATACVRTTSGSVPGKAFAFIVSTLNSVISFGLGRFVPGSTRHSCSMIAKSRSTRWPRGRG